MSSKPKKWPTYALDSLEGTLYHLKTVTEMGRVVQVVAKELGQPDLLILGGDIRDRARDAIHLLVQARTGEYDDPTTSTNP